MHQHAAQLGRSPAGGELGVGVQPPAVIHRHRADPRLGHHLRAEQPAGQVREAGRGPQPPGGQARDLVAAAAGHPRSSPASRSTGANSRTSAGSATPSGRHRASVRAATAATSGAVSAARPSTCQPADPALRRGVGRDHGGHRGHRRVGPVPAAGQQERGRVGQHGLRVGQVHLGQPGQELHSRAVAHRAADERRARLLTASGHPARGPQPGRHLPGPRAGPAAAGRVRVGRRGTGERGPRVQERGHQGQRQAQFHGPVLRQPWHLRRRPATGQPVGHRARVDVPRQVAQPVGQRRRQVPPVGGLVRWVGRGHHRHLGGQLQVADHPLQHHPEQRRLHGGRGGGQLIEEQQSAAGLGQAAGPGGRREPDPVTHHHGQPGEVGRLADRRDHGLARPAQGLRHGPDDRRLAGARGAPQQHRHSRRHGHPECLHRGRLPLAPCPGEPPAVLSHLRSLSYSIGALCTITSSAVVALGRTDRSCRSFGPALASRCA